MIDKLTDSLGRLGFLHNTTICDLHKPCRDNKCTSSSSEFVIDYDAFKDWFYKQNQESTKKSVDALILKEAEIFFVEIKGWEKYLEHNKFSNKAVDKQIEGYKFENKYIDSFELLARYVHLYTDIFETADIEQFKGISKYYVVVTDIDYKVNPLESLAETLNFLAQTQNSENYCYKRMSEYIKNINISDDEDKRKPIGQQVVYCKDFDKGLHLYRV